MLGNKSTGRLCMWCPRPAVCGALCRLCARALRERRASTRRLIQRGVMGRGGWRRP